MKFAAVSLLLAATSAVAQAPDKIALLPIYTQVREDIFAGYMGGDMERYAKGKKRLNSHLESNPTSAGAVSLLASTIMFEAARANEAGDAKKSAELFQKSIDTFKRAYDMSPKDGGVLAVTGASTVYFADRLPEKHRRAANELGRARFLELKTLQESMLGGAPPHIKGELLGGLAQAEQRLGNWEASKAYLTKIVETMEGTPYKPRAARWLERPETAAKSSMVCMTCHEPGRLESRLRDLESQKK